MFLFLLIKEKFNSIKKCLIFGNQLHLVWYLSKCCPQANKSETKIMASSPISSWQINGETMETVTDFIFLGSKMQMVTAAMKLKDACSLEEKL